MSEGRHFTVVIKTGGLGLIISPRSLIVFVRLRGRGCHNFHVLLYRRLKLDDFLLLRDHGHGFGHLPSFREARTALCHGRAMIDLSADGYLLERD